MKTEAATTAQVLADNYRSLTRELEWAEQAESDLGRRDEMLVREQFALSAQIRLVQQMAKQLGLVDEVVAALNQ
jgi:hypothetical protein